MKHLVQKKLHWPSNREPDRAVCGSDLRVHRAAVEKHQVTCATCHKMLRGYVEKPEGGYCGCHGVPVLECPR